MTDVAVKAKLYAAGLYPTEYAIALEGGEEQRAENTDAIARGLPHMQPADVLAIRLLMICLEPDIPLPELS